MILLAYSGTGKSYLAAEKPNVADLEDYLFYEENSPFKDYELWSRHLFYYGIFKEGIALAHPDPSLRETLLQKQIPYILVMPSITLKDEYLERFKVRGSRADFIKNQDETWISRHKLLPEENIIYLKSEEYLIDKLEECEKLWNNVIDKDNLLKLKEKFIKKFDIK